MTDRIRLLTDEDVRGQVVTGLRRHHPQIDLVDVREVGLESTPDPIVLEWAAVQGRVLVTQDEETMIDFAWDRVELSLHFPGLIVAPLRCPVALAIREIAELVARSDEEPLDDRVVHLPLDKSWRVREEEPEWAAATGVCEYVET